jgi:hypothetical protein
VELRYNTAYHMRCQLLLGSGRPRGESIPSRKTGSPRWFSAEEGRFLVWLAWGCFWFASEPPAAKPADYR